MSIFQKMKDAQRVKDISAGLMTPQERQRVQAREVEARKIVLSQDVRAMSQRGDHRGMLAALKAVLRHDERASLFTVLGAEGQAALCRALPETLDVMRPAIGALAIENLKISITPDDQLPALCWVSGPSQVKTGGGIVDEDQADLLESAGLTIDAGLVRNAQPPVLAKPSPVRDHGGLWGFPVMPVNLVDSSKPQYARRVRSFAFGSGARLRVTRTVQVSLGYGHGFAERQIEEDGGESPISIPRLIDRAVVDVLLEVDREFAARAIVTPGSPAEIRRHLQINLSNEAQRSMGRF